MKLLTRKELSLLGAQVGSAVNVWLHEGEGTFVPLRVAYLVILTIWYNYLLLVILKTCIWCITAGVIWIWRRLKKSK
jgi:hypothetical protein